MKILFTFHYVSISTKYGLIAQPCTLSFTFHYVSISTFLPVKDKINKSLFTFHYVSISTLPGIAVPPTDHHLHSTMYLFQHCYS